MSYPKVALSNLFFSEANVNNNKNMLEGLIVLEYLNLGIMPFYPYSPEISTGDRKAKRKFRKLWRKVSKKQNSYEWVRSPFNTPSGKIMWQRKIIVHDWIRNQVKKKYKLQKRKP